MDFNGIAAARLLNQQITATAFKTAAEMVAWFGAIQGQEYAQTKWSLGLRLPQLTDSHIEEELNSGRILRTHLLRPTWHFVTAQDIRWMLKLTASRVHAASAYMYRQLELTAPYVNRCHEVLIKTLEGGKHISRPAINKEFMRNGIEIKGMRLTYIMMMAELEGIVCSGARKGKQATYALLEERVPKAKSLTRDESLATLAHRYFSSRGPATVHDFSAWSGLTVTDCRKALEMVEQKFNKEKINDEEYIFPNNNTTGERRLQNIYLLPVYDEYIMGYKNREAILQIRNKIKPTPEFMFYNTLMWEGQITGTWRRIIKPNAIELEYTPFRPFTQKQHKAFEREISRFEEFNGLKVNYREVK